MYAGLDANISSHLKLLRLRLDVDDVLVLYTDGITEAMDAQGRQFEPAGIIEAVRPVRDRSAQEIQSAILDACEKHIGTARRYDDISVVVVRKLADPGWDGQMRGTVHVGDAIDTDHGIESTCSLRFLPLDMFDNWQRGSMVSDFTADYFRHNFPSEQQVGLISTVVNELVENAVKFTPKNSLPVELTFKKSKDSLIVEATNSVPSNRCLRFMTVCRELFERNLDDVYLERMDQNTKDASSSGLGLLLIKKDYSARLGFHFHFDDEGTVRVTVTTQLDFSEPEGGSHG
jgi:sigma-B regulation protein RsbU (phosphoserine phosphatase)